MERQRLDSLLVERGLAHSRSRARQLILSGGVRVNGEVVDRPSRRPPTGAELLVEDNGLVSRAGEKLEAALEEFGISVAGRDCLDAGSSTGGFTEVLLRRGAGRVAAVEVGTAQLAERLRSEARITLMENTNIRHLTGGDLPFGPRLLVADLSFIPLFVALEGIVRSTPSIEECVLLVKPQFEVGPGGVGRGGLVRGGGEHAEAVEAVASAFESLGFGAVGVMRSPVAGRRAGNSEYPLYLVRGVPRRVSGDRIRAVIST